MRPVILFIAAAILVTACIAAPAAAEVYYHASLPQIITKGDTFSVSGTGAVNGTVALWVIGRDYFDVRSSSPDRHGNFSFFFKPTETEKFKSGQYVVVLQDPGPSGTMEIEPGHDSSGNLTIMNRGKIIARLGAQEDLKANVRSEADELLSSATLQGVDDSFLAGYFFVEEPAVHFDTIIPASGSRLPDVISGDGFRFTGTTNLGAENILRAEIRNADTNIPVTAKDIPITPGSSVNSWNYGIDAPGLEAGHYTITVGWTRSNTTGTGTALFTVKGADNPSHVVPPPTQGPVNVPLPRGLDTLLIIGIIVVFAVVVYTLGRK